MPGASRAGLPRNKAGNGRDSTRVRELPFPAVDEGQRRPGGSWRRPGLAGGSVEVLADKSVDVAVEDALGVADFEVGAMVLDHGVGLEHVGADL